MNPGGKIPASLRVQANNPPRFIEPASRGDNRCETCTFVQTMKVLGNPDAFHCHRFPPQIVVVPQQTVEGIMATPATAFPTVGASHWCAEFAPVQASNAKGTG